MVLLDKEAIGAEEEGEVITLPVGGTSLSPLFDEELDILEKLDKNWQNGSVTIFPSGHSTAAKKNPMGPKRIFPIDRH